MGNAKYVGRVGGLAVALGVGSLIAAAPAWATESDSGNSGNSGSSSNSSSSSGSSSGSGSSASSGSDNGDSSTTGGSTTGGSTTGGSTTGGTQTDETATDGKSTDDKPTSTRKKSTTKKSSVRTYKRYSLTTTPKAKTDADATTSTASATDTTSSATTQSKTARTYGWRSPKADVPAETTAAVSTSQAVTSKTVSSFRFQYKSLTGKTTEVTVPAAPVEVVVSAPTVTKLGYIFSTLTLRTGATGLPGAPGQSPAIWVALAAARREIGSLSTAKIADTSTAQTTGEVVSEGAAGLGSNADVAAAAAAAAAAGTVSTAAEEEPNDQAPVISKVTVGKPSSSGSVKGTVTATDPQKDPILYGVDVNHQPAKGTVVFKKNAFTYTPTAESRHAAAKVGAPSDALKDTFTVTVTDSLGNVTTRTVEVTIKPANVKPTAIGAAVGQTRASDGRVIGTAWATDVDGDSLTLRGTTPPAKGNVVYDAEKGVFTYTPTEEAFAAANAPKAKTSAKTDKFTVALDDGHGGVVTKTITVSLVKVDQDAFTGVGNGTIATGTTGTKFEMVTALSSTANGRKSPTKVIVINPDGTAAATVTISGIPDPKGGGFVVNDEGGVYFTTVNGSKTQVSVISATGALSTSTAMSGAPAGQIKMASDGTGYLTVGNLSSTKKTTISLVQIKPNGQTVVTKLSGIPADGVTVIGDTAYQAYTDGTTGKVLAITGDGSVTTVVTAVGDKALGTSARPDGSVYLTTYNQTSKTTKVYTINGTELAANPVVINGSATGEAVVSADGTAFVLTTINTSTNPKVPVLETTLTGITADGVVRTRDFSDFAPGYRGKFGELLVGPDGKAYMGVTSRFSDGFRVQIWDPANQSTQWVDLPDGHTAGNIDRLALGPDGTLYVTSTTDDIVTIRDGVREVVDGTAGTVDFEIGADGVAYAAVADEGVLRLVNVTTGESSPNTLTGGIRPENPSGTLGDSLNALTVASDGRVVLKSYRTERIGTTDVRFVSVLAVNADGTLIGTQEMVGYGAWTTFADDGSVYVAAYNTPIGDRGTPDLGNARTYVYKLEDGSATALGDVLGLATGPVAVDSEGNVTFTTFSGTKPSNVTTTLHIRSAIAS